MKKIFGLVLSAVALFGMVSCAGQPGAKGDKGDTGAPGADGKDGVSIVSIELTSSEGLEDTYTITFSDNTTTTFVVTNGAQGEPGKDGTVPTVEIGDNGNWFINGEDTNIKAEGVDGTPGTPGENGLTPYIGENGNWWIGDEDTEVKAKGEDGTSSEVEIGENGNWFIDGVDTGIKAEGQDGADGTDGKDGVDGEDGLTPYIGENGNWWIGTEDTGIKAQGQDGTDGQDGLTPFIGENGNWWIGDKDTEVKAKGEDGTSSKVEIGENGNWFIDGVDTGIKAEGQDGADGTDGKDGVDGEDGLTPYIGENGNWWIGTEDTGIKAQGQDGTDGKDGQDGLTPFIGENGNWWIGDKDTGVSATGKTTEEIEVFYTVDFDLNGGNFIGEVDLAQYEKVLANSTISLPVPVRERFVFEGWFTGKGVNDSKFSNNSTVNGDLTLIAKWAEIDNYVYIKERRDEVIEELSRDFWSRNSIDNVTSSLYEQYMNYVSEINFAESIDQINQITSEYYNWISELPIDQELVITLRNELEQYWEYVVSSYPTISETDYPMMYEELLSKLNNDSYTENEFIVFQEEFYNFRSEVEYWINEITLDEWRVNELRETATNLRTVLESFFGGVLDYNRETKYFSDENIAYLDGLIAEIDSVQNNNQVENLQSSINSLEYELLNDKFFEFEQDKTRKYEFLREIAGNVYSDIESKYNALKEEYGLSEGASPYIEDMLNQINEFITNPEFIMYERLGDAYYNYLELINELDNLQNNSQVSVTYGFIPPYDFLGFQSTGGSELKGDLNTELNINEIANYYLEEGFVLEGIYKDQSYSEAYEIRFDEETQSYFLKLSEEAGFVTGATTKIYPKFKVSDAELAKEAASKWFEEYCIPNLEMGLKQTGLDVADYEESFNSVRTTISNITDETTFDIYLKDGINLYLTIAREVANFQLTANYDNLLKNYPELLEDPLFEEYNSRYQEILNNIETISAVNEFNDTMNGFIALFNEVLNYAKNAYGDRGVSFIYSVA